MLDALLASYAVVSLPDSLNRAVVTYQVFSFQAPVIFLLTTLDYISVIHTVIVVLEDCRDVYSVRARHTIFTSGARYCRVVLCRTANASINW